MEVKRVVRTIPANVMQVQNTQVPRKQKVCAYARVSTDSEEQLSSYTLQCEHYTKFITANTDWEFVGIYADEGVTGTSVKRRKEFLRMMDDARAGKIDIIYCKSISRFARNTVDCLTYIRELRELNIDVVFETGGLHTLGTNGEIVISLLASLAEDGSRVISENVRWAKQKRFEKGEVAWAYKFFLGYTKGENGGIEIVPKEAELVRRIYNEFLNGSSVNQIVNGIQADGILTSAGKAKWQRSTILSILKNEKYKGDAILQKTYQRDFLSKKRIKNEGHAPQYLVENSHPPIVSRELFDMVQIELERRANPTASNGARTRYASEYGFSGKLVCAECGATMTRGNKISSGSKFHIWLCPTHRHDTSACPTKAVNEEDIEDAFVDIVTEFIEHKQDYYNKWQNEIDNHEIESLEGKQSRLESLQQEMYELNTRNKNQAIDGEQFHKNSLALMDEMDILLKDIKRVETLKRERLLQRFRQTQTQEILRPIEKFDEELFKTLVEYIKIDKDKKLNFMLKCGIVIEI